MPHHRVYLDGAPGGPWMGHALEEIGCVWLAPTREEAMARAPAAIAGFLTWLRVNGEPGVVPVRDDDVTVSLEDVQEVPGFGQSGSAVGLFDPDLAPVTDSDIATTVRRLGYARRDLLETVAGLPPEVLDWRPPGGKWTVRQNLVHVSNGHGFYLSRLLGRQGAEAVLPAPWPDDLLAGLNWVLGRAVAALLELPPSFRSGVFRADHPAEDWTARKMLRRFVEHEREHVEVVRHTLRGREQG